MSRLTECFLAKYHLDVTRVRQLRPAHLEEYKQRRAEGRISKSKTQEETKREQELRLQITGKRRKDATPEERAKFGWLGRHGIKVSVSHRTINYELRVLFTFFH